ncbi:MAG: DNA translocase FtsK [Anaerolineae bacterium]|nr:DNA translocase FtsK [Anaerolineae bacterium]
MTAEYTEVATYWRGIVGTLAQRGLLRQRVDGQKVIPQAVAIVEPERVCFVLDLLRLGGVSREDWLNRDLWAQIKAASQGRRVIVADGGGLAVVIARQPGEPQRKRLPRRVILDAEAIPSGDYTATLGESKAGPVVLDLAGAERALLVGGTSGSGKTSAIKSIVLQLARKNDPDRLALAIVDLKRLDFTALSELPHLARPVATTEAEAFDLVCWAVQEMQRRQAVMQAARVTRWDKLPEGERFPLLLVVIDEAADFAKSEVMPALIELARKGRASGISLILATQRPDSQVISPQVKANLPARLAFQTTTGIESRVILDRGGAEDLRRVGQCLTNAGGKWQRVQAAYVPDGALGEWVDAPSGPALDDAERALVQFALDELGGCFTINALADAFQGEVSRRQLLKLGKAWELRGWLTSPDDVTEARQVTDELAALARGNGGNGRGNASGAVVPRGISGNVVPENGQGGGVELPAFLAKRFEGVQR